MAPSATPPLGYYGVIYGVIRLESREITVAADEQDSAACCDFMRHLAFPSSKGAREAMARQSGYTSTEQQLAQLRRRNLQILGSMANDESRE